MKKLYIIDHIDHNAEVEQYGKTCKTHDEAMEVFAEALHAFNLDDEWKGLAGVVQASDDAESLVIRTIEIPEEV